MAVLYSELKIRILKSRFRALSREVANTSLFMTKPVAEQKRKVKMLEKTAEELHGPIVGEARSAINFFKQMWREEAALRKWKKRRALRKGLVKRSRRRK